MIRCFLFLAASILSSALVADDRPRVTAARSPELEKLEKFVGNWTGTGRLHTPNGRVLEWTAKSTYKWILGDHFLREEIRVDIELPGAAPLIARAYHGYDRVAKRFVSFTVSSTGKVTRSRSHSLTDATMIEVVVTTDEGVPEAGRSRQTFKSPDEFEVISEVLRADAKVAPRFEGTYRRSGAAYEISEEELRSGQIAAPPQMKRLAGLVGSYRIKGKATQMPGTQAIATRGTEHVRSVFGGSALIAVHAGGPDGAEGNLEVITLIGWNPEDRSYVRYWLSNMGFLGHSTGRFVDNSLVTTTNRLGSGQPGVERSVLTLDENGSISTLTVDHLRGVDKPLRSYEASFERIETEVAPEGTP